MQFYLPYGTGEQVLELADDADVEVLAPRAKRADICSEEELVQNAMNAPIASPTLKELAAGRKDAVIICSDHTRPVPSKKILPAMLRELRAGNAEIQITLLIATGCHRTTTREELIQKFGEEIVARERVIVHNCDDKRMLAEVGTLPSGAKLIVNREALETELLLAEGFIEPHFFAGFSGGRKSVLPGICARKTVMENHCAAFIADPRARTGVLEGNPIHRDMLAAAEMVKLRYIVNVVLDEQKHMIAAFAGNARHAHEAGCAYQRKRCEVHPTRPADIVVTTNGGAPLDQNLYQAVKGMTAAETAAADKGAIIICAACTDGVGGEQFFKAMKECTCARDLREKIERTMPRETLPDQWQYQILARVMENHRICVVCEEKTRKAAEEMKLCTAATVQEAYVRLSQGMVNPRVTIIPDGVSVIVSAFA